MQVDPTRPKLKPPGIKLLKLKCDTLPLNFAFKFNLRRNNQAVALDPEDVSFITNKAAVNFEKQDYEAGRCRLTLSNPR